MERGPCVHPISKTGSAHSSDSRRVLIGSALAAGGRRRPAASGATLLMVLIIVGIIFVLGTAAMTSAIRTTQVGENYAAAAVALQAAQTGIAVADRRLVHPWYDGYTICEDWPGNGRFDMLPDCSDGLGGRYDMYYSITVASTVDQHTVTSSGLAVIAGRDPGMPDNVGATRTIQAVFDKPKVQVPYSILADGDLTIRPNIHVNGDIFCNGDLAIAFTALVAGDVYATGAIFNFGQVAGSEFPGQPASPLPPILYYGYRPSYDYNGMDCDATELGKSLETEPPMGMPNNPNNVFYSNHDPDFKLKNGVTINGGTVITMCSLIIEGDVTITATPGFPALIINRDLILTDGCTLKTEGLVQVGREVKGTGSGELSANAVWQHIGPVVFKGSQGFDSNLASDVQIIYRADRVDIQPVGRMVLPLIPRSYTETP